MLFYATVTLAQSECRAIVCGLQLTVLLVMNGGVRVPQFIINYLITPCRRKATEPAQATFYPMMHENELINLTNSSHNSCIDLLFALL